MKAKISSILGLGMLIMVALAYDPAGPPPKKTMEWTTKSLSRNILPSVNITDMTIEEAVEFIGVLEVPDAYKPKIDCSRIPDKLRKVKFSGTDLTRLEAIGKLAQAIDADILISPGKVTLIPRNQGEGSGGKRE